MSEPPPNAAESAHAKWFWPLAALSTYVGLGIFGRHADLMLDDAFIYFRVVRNLLEGHGPVFNPGDGHTALTSPLWTFSLALAKWSAPGVEYPVLAKLLSAGWLVVACLFAGLLLRPHAGWCAGFAPLGVVLTPVVLGRVGLGIPLALSTCLATLWAFQGRRHPAWVGALLGLAYLSRGECVLLGPLMALFAFLQMRRRNTTARSALRYVTVIASAAALVALVWHAYYFLEFGAFVPETLRAKIYQGARGWPLYTERVWARLELATRGSVVFVAFAALGAVAALRRMPIVLAWPLAHYAAYGALGVAFYAWYYYDIELVVTLCGLFGFVGCVRWCAQRGSARLVRTGASERLMHAGSVTVVLLAVVLAFPHFAEIPKVYSVRSESFAQLFTPRIGPFLEWDRTKLRGRGKTYYRAAKWLNENAGTVPEKCVLVDEIGVLGYFCHDWEIRDTVGLATPLSDVDELMDFDLHVVTQRPTYLFQLGSELAAECVFQVGEGNPLRYELAHAVRFGGQPPRGGWYVRSDT